jgi:hypothetical protein
MERENDFFTWLLGIIAVFGFVGLAVALDQRNESRKEARELCRAAIGGLERVLYRDDLTLPQVRMAVRVAEDVVHGCVSDVELEELYTDQSMQRSVVLGRIRDSLTFGP